MVLCAVLACLIQVWIGTGWYIVESSMLSNGFTVTVVAGAVVESMGCAYHRLRSFKRSFLFLSNSSLYVTCSWMVAMFFFDSRRVCQELVTLCKVYNLILQFPCKEVSKFFRSVVTTD